MRLNFLIKSRYDFFLFFCLLIQKLHLKAKKISYLYLTVLAFIRMWILPVVFLDLLGLWANHAMSNPLSLKQLDDL